MGHFLAGRENCFQHSERVGEELHPHSVGLQVCPELQSNWYEDVCKVN